MLTSKNTMLLVRVLFTRYHLVRTVPNHSSVLLLVRLMLWTSHNDIHYREQVVRTTFVKGCTVRFRSLNGDSTFEKLYPAFMFSYLRCSSVAPKWYLGVISVALRPKPQETFHGWCELYCCNVIVALAVLAWFYFKPKSIYSI